jgi:hypothetical protein
MQSFAKFKPVRAFIQPGQGLVCPDYWPTHEVMMSSFDLDHSEALT